MNCTFTPLTKLNLYQRPNQLGVGAQSEHRDVMGQRSTFNRDSFDLQRRSQDSQPPQNMPALSTDDGAAIFDRLNAMQIQIDQLTSSIAVLTA